MDYNIEFQIAALVIVFGIFITYLFSDRPNEGIYRVFLFHIISEIVTLFFDIFSVIAIAKRNTYPIWLTDFLSKGYIVSMQMWISLTVLYVLASAYGDMPGRKRKIYTKTASILVGVAFLYVATIAVIYPIYYFGSGRQIFSYGIPSSCTYVFSSCGVVFCVATIIGSFRRMTFEEIFPILGFVLMEGTVALIQSKFPFLLILGIGSAFTEFLMFRSLEIISHNNLQQRIINSFSGLIEGRDKSTGDHVKRTRTYVRLILEELQHSHQYRLTRKEINTIVAAAAMHDIGKITIPDSILQKKGRLTDEEYETIKTHTTSGAELIMNNLNNIGTKEWTSTAYNMAFYHHERWDGKGYPCGLKENGIPFCAQVMAIADVFDAVSQDRCYREKMTLDESFEIIEKGRGTCFNPMITDSFLRIREKVMKRYEQLNR